MVDKVSETSTDTNSEDKSEDPPKADGSESTDLRIKANEIINKNIKNRNEYNKQNEKENNVKDELKFTDKEDYKVLIAAQKLIEEDIILNKNNPTKLSTGWFTSAIDEQELNKNIELQLKYYQVSTGGTRKKYKLKKSKSKSKSKSKRKTKRKSKRNSKRR